MSYTILDSLWTMIGEVQARSSRKPKLRWRHDRALNGWTAKRGQAAVLAVDFTLKHRLREASLLTFAHGWAPDMYIDADREPIQ